MLFHTRDLLRERGHEVLDFAMRDDRNVPSPQSEFFAPHRDYNDKSRPLASRVLDATASVYSVKARKQLRRLLEQERPDIAHMHIISHQLTMSIVDELRRHGIPSVITLHDYKIGCPAYVLYRDGQPCRLCTTGHVENAFRYRCLKGSRAASLLATTEARLARARHSWDHIDIHIGPSAFAGDVAIEAGIPRDRVHVIPNFLPDSEVSQRASRFADPPRFFLASRLEAVKGVRELLAAFVGAPRELGTLVIAGAGGELEDDVQAAATREPNIEYLGRISRDDVLDQLRRSRAALVPSLWDENNPMSLLEARAAGVPVIATRVGGLPEMVTDGVDGLLVDPGDVLALRAAASQLAENPALATAMAEAGHRRLRAENSADAHYEKLMEAYRHATELTRERSGIAFSGSDIEPPGA